MSSSVPLLFAAIGLAVTLHARYLEATLEGFFSTLSPLINLFWPYPTSAVDPSSPEWHPVPFFLLFDPGQPRNLYILGLSLSVLGIGLALSRLRISYDSLAMTAVAVGLSAIFLMDLVVGLVVLLCLIIYRLSTRAW